MNEDIKIRKAEKLRRYKGMNAYAKKGGIVMLGSSLMEHFMINEFLMDAGMEKTVYNRAVEGWHSDELYKNLETCVYELEPSKIFINIGSNDLDRPGDPLGELIKQYRKILRHIRERFPECVIYIMAYYPVLKLSPTIQAGNFRIRTKESIDRANTAIETLAVEMGCELLNINHVLIDREGYLLPEFAADYIHLNPSAYKVIFDELKKYI